MKSCPNCNANMPDQATHCSVCGTPLNQQPNNPNFNNGGFNNGYAPYAPIDPYDHTAEFTQKDISDNKVYAMSVYLLGFIGIIIALLASHDSPYTAFHVRQAIKFLVVDTLLAICSIFLIWTFIVPFAAGVMEIVLFVIKIICFFQICSGKAKEPAIIRSLNFLK